MNIVLIGYRGCGKTRVAEALSRRTGRPRYSLDDEIVAAAGASIPDIVAQHGWEHFRDLESRIVAQFATHTATILDTGGGAILRSQNVAALKQNGRLFWLTARVDTIARRIQGDTQRPSLTGAQSFVDEIAEVLTTREPLYRAAADHVLATDDRSPEHLAAALAALCD